MGAIKMKKLIQTLIEKIENNADYIPFHLSEPVKANSQN